MSRVCKTIRRQTDPCGIKHSLLDVLIFQRLGFRTHYLHSRILRGIATLGPLCAGELLKKIETGVKIDRLCDFIRELKAQDLVTHKMGKGLSGGPLNLLHLTEAGEALYKASRKPKAPAAES